MLVTRANTPRVYVNDPRQWGVSVGTDYLMGVGTTTALITAGTAGQVLSEFGWTTTALGYSASTGADFLSAADGLTGTYTPQALLFDASGDILKSPQIFGEYFHGAAAGFILGYVPTVLNLEAYIKWTVASANETQSAIGFLEAGGTASVAADHLAAMFSDGTNFKLRSGAATSAAGIAVDNVGHLLKISISSTTVDWFLDGVIQPTLALEADLFPVSFFAHVLTTNRLSLGPVRIWYQ